MNPPSRFGDVTARDRLLLRAAVGRGADAVTAWRAWIGDGDLDGLPHPEGRLLSWVFSNLQSQHLAAELPARMRGKYRWVWSSNHLRARSVDPVLRELERRGIPTMLLKGAGLLAAGRCTWGAREMGDVDVLVPTPQAGVAATVLETLGWRGVSGVDADYLARRLVRRRHSWNFVGASDGAVDLHWHAVDGVGGRDADALLWREGQRAVFGEAATRWLGATAQLVHTIQHGARGEPAHRLVWLADTACLLEDADPTRLRELTAALGLRDVTIEGLEHAVSALGARRAGELARQLSTRRAAMRERLRTSATEQVIAARVPAAGQLLQVGLAQRVTVTRPLTSTRDLVARCVEPSCTRHPAVSTLLAVAGRPRRMEALALRAAGPIARPPRARTLPTGVWIDVATGPMVDVVCGPGWSWPDPDGSGVWAEGAEARLALTLDHPDGEDVVLEFLLGPAVHVRAYQSVHVSVNARPVTEWNLDAGAPQHPHTVEVPAWLAAWCRPLEVTFRPRITVPSRDDVANDPARRLIDDGGRRQFLQLRALRVRTPDADGNQRRDVVAAWEDVARGPDARVAINPHGDDPAAYDESGEDATVALAALIGDDPDLVVVDFGAGDGRVTLPLARRYRHVIAVDSSPTMLGRLSARCPAIDTVLADGTDATALPVDVDVVVALAVLIHHRHADAARIIRGLAAMLRPGGRLILDLALYEIGREPTHWIDISVWTRAELELLAADTGLEILTAWASPGAFDGTNVGPHHAKVLVLQKR